MYQLSKWFSVAGLPVKNPALNKKKVEKIEVEDRFAYLSDEDNSDDNKDDEDWSPSKEIQQRPISSRQQSGEGKMSLFWKFESLFCCVHALTFSTSVYKKVKTFRMIEMQHRVLYFSS